MGYYTYFELEVVSTKNTDEEDILTYMRDEIKARDSFYPFRNQLKDKERDNFNYFYSDDAYKWYDHDLEMIEMSLEFPDVLFKLHGDGEESLDVWNNYYRNGKMLSYCATIPEYHETDWRNV